MKRSDIFFTFLLLPIDFLMLITAGVFVYFLRYETFLTEFRPVVFELAIGNYIRMITFVAFLWIPIFAIAGMYSIRRPRRFTDEIAKVILGCSTGFIAIVFLIFFRHELFGSRFIVLVGWFSAIFFVSFGRLVIRAVQKVLYKRNIGVFRAVVFGDDVGALRFSQAIKKDPKSGFKIVRHLKKFDSTSLGLLLNIAKSNGADMVILADPNWSRENQIKLLSFCNERHMEFSYVSDTFETSLKNVEITDIAGVPLVHIKHTPLDGWGRIAKRAMDIIFSIIAILIMAPFWFVLGILIKLDSIGTVFVKLKRVGVGGKCFFIYKFRSMVQDAHILKNHLKDQNERSDGPLFKITKDPRITKVGKFIRRYSLDELPNFVNVLLGDMSLVGPRPHEPEEVGKYLGGERKLLNIKPGVSGLAQISGRSDLSFNEEARLDLFYIENWSMGLDIKILLRTPWVVLRGKNAS
jgi:exopolysaccharide biosynthesis polyprenyl glycosylphosphotransferase